MPKYDCKSGIIELSPGYILAHSVHIRQDSNHLFSRTIYITEILTSDCKNNAIRRCSGIIFVESSNILDLPSASKIWFVA
jgi:hypothetical protein